MKKLPNTTWFIFVSLLFGEYLGHRIVHQVALFDTLSQLHVRPQTCLLYFTEIMFWFRYGGLELRTVRTLGCAPIIARVICTNKLDSNGQADAECDRFVHRRSHGLRKRSNEITR